MTIEDGFLVTGGALRGKLANQLNEDHQCAEAARAAARVGECIGPYRLVRLLGSGGMGEVYLAERSEGEFTQQVALKLVREELASAVTRERFE